MSPNLIEKVTFTRSWDPRAVCAITLALVFLCGVAAGAVAMNFGGLHAKLHQPSFDTAAGKALYFSRMRRELNLTPQQQEQMESVLNDCWVYYRTLLTDSKARVEQILTEEQRVKFEHLLQEYQPR
jgi:Spy/CpxP family protein refolding chaperone